MNYKSYRDIKYTYPLIWLLIAILLWGILSFSANFNSLLELFHDDSFFYIVLARNLSNGFGYSFDMINSTNGFHPLWLWLLAAISHFVELKGDFGVRIVTFIYGFFSILSAFIYLSILKVQKSSKAAQLIFVLIYIFGCSFSDVGLESALFGFLFSILVWLSFLTHWKKIFFLCPLVILCLIFCRQDSIFVIAAIGLAFFFSKRKIESLVVFSSILSGLALLAIFNEVNFGYSRSISSWLKFHFELGNLNQLLTIGLFVRIFFILSMLWMSYYISRSERPKIWIHNLIKYSLILYTIYLLILFSSVQGLGSWYLNQIFAFSLFLLFLAISNFKVSKTYKLFSFLCLFLLFIFTASLATRKIIFDSIAFSGKEMGMYIKNHTNTTDIFFNVDGSGRLSYFSERKIINGDGLVNNMQYHAFIKEGRVCEYLKRNKVLYIVTNAPVIDGFVVDKVPMWRNKEYMSFLKAEPQDSIYQVESYRLFKFTGRTTNCKSI
jgi:hypothetical protein